MKKLTCAFLALLLSSIAVAAPSSSTVFLPGGGVIDPTATLTLPLAPLLKGVYYNLTCELNNPQMTTVDMSFDLSATGAAASARYSQVVLNEKVLTNHQGSLQSGKNSVTLKDLSVEDAEQAVQFRNLDFGHTAEVSHCVAKPSISAMPLPTSGSFFLKNDSHFYVKTLVGNFFPDTFVLPPHSSQLVFVSTNNQNIRISDVW